MVRILFIWDNIYVGHWGSYGLKQGNPMIILITNQIILILFIFYGFLFTWKFLSKLRFLFCEGKYVSDIEAATALNRGIPCAFLNR